MPTSKKPQNEIEGSHRSKRLFLANELLIEAKVRLGEFSRRLNNPDNRSSTGGTKTDELKSIGLKPSTVIDRYEKMTTEAAEIEIDRARKDYLSTGIEGRRTGRRCGTEWAINKTAAADAVKVSGPMNQSRPSARPAEPFESLVNYDGSKNFYLFDAADMKDRCKVLKRNLSIRRGDFWTDATRTR